MMFTNPVRQLQERATLALLARMPAGQRNRLVAKLLAEMPEADRQRLLVHSPNFIQFAQTFLLSIGRPRC